MENEEQPGLYKDPSGGKFGILRVSLTGVFLVVLAYLAFALR